MNYRIYCKTTAKSIQSYYLSIDKQSIFLFSQAFRKSNKKVYEKGVYLFDLKKLRKNSSFSVSRTAEKIPAYIHYIEQYFGIDILNKTKQKKYQFNYKLAKLKSLEYAGEWNV